MSGCTQTGKPQIAILLAVYEPRLDWLREQLESLEKQSYPNLKLYVRDDCSPTVPFGEIEACVKGCIHAFPYEIRRNEENLGSNRTFERLTEEAEGEYFAYCDQDDVWLPEKLAVLHQALVRDAALLVCSDMLIIDAHGRLLADSICKIRRRHRFHSGTGLAEGLLLSNFVTGCTMLVRSGEAKAALPFCPYMVHDHYLALYCAAKGGEIRSILRPLICYRVHSGNQTGPMAGVTGKRSYGAVRVDLPLEKFRWLQREFPYRRELAEAIGLRLRWMEARQQYLRGSWRMAGIIWKYRRFSPKVSLFEIAMPYMPVPLFRLSIWASAHNYI